MYVHFLLYYKITKNHMGLMERHNNCLQTPETLIGEIASLLSDFWLGYFKINLRSSDICSITTRFLSHSIIMILQFNNQHLIRPKSLRASINNRCLDLVRNSDIVNLEPLRDVCVML